MLSFRHVIFPGVGWMIMIGTGHLRKLEREPCARQWWSGYQTLRTMPQTVPTGKELVGQCSTLVVLSVSTSLHWDVGCSWSSAKLVDKCKSSELDNGIQGAASNSLLLAVSQADLTWIGLVEQISKLINFLGRRRLPRECGMFLVSHKTSFDLRLSAEPENVIQETAHNSLLLRNLS